MFVISLQFFLKLSAVRRKRFISYNSQNRVSRIALINTKDVSFKHDQHLLFRQGAEKRRVRFRLPRFARFRGKAAKVNSTKWFTRKPKDANATVEQNEMQTMSSATIV